jgi:hypothetical protein
MILADHAGILAQKALHYAAALSSLSALRATILSASLRDLHKLLCDANLPELDLFQS